MALDCNRSILA